MESMGKKPRRRRSFTPEFKAEIVEMCQRGDRSVGQVAKDFDLTEPPRPRICHRHNREQRPQLCYCQQCAAQDQCHQ